MLLHIPVRIASFYAFHNFQVRVRYFLAHLRVLWSLNLASRAFVQVLEGFYGQQSLLQQQSAAANAMRQQTQAPRSHQPNHSASPR